eukprot:CAMPEP_0182445398 /NCGR_PEP_ID=MMETSP1172-20130603/3536_1 /TAXON_ID=708627 /ORGANISM="Timspurckia oligopyrenoides, Strain CCMP3278" /LENGTH=152 /DNA_ID=CAMNT_0024641163 /DNA_START=181 /DNA_END=636 /DNA_ORIENTATION=-
MTRSNFRNVTDLTLDDDEFENGVFSVGSNAYGQLGAGHELGTFSITPVKARIPSGIDFVDPNTNLIVGHETCMLLSQSKHGLNRSSTLVGWGRGEESQLIGTRPVDSYLPRDLIPQLKKSWRKSNEALTDCSEGLPGIRSVAMSYVVSMFLL